MHTATLPMKAPLKIQQTSRFTRTSVKPMWKDTTLTTNANGHEEAYSIAPDGFVWSYTVDSELGRTGRLNATGLRADTFAIGKSAKGHNIVIAATGADVHFVTETRDPQQRWSASRKMNFPAAQKNIEGIDKILLQNLEGNLFVGVLNRHSIFEREDRYQFWGVIWVDEGMVFSLSPLEIEHQSKVWLDVLANALITS